MAKNQLPWKPALFFNIAAFIAFAAIALISEYLVERYEIYITGNNFLFYSIMAIPAALLIIGLVMSIKRIMLQKDKTEKKEKLAKTGRVLFVVGAAVLVISIVLLAIISIQASASYSHEAGAGVTYSGIFLGYINLFITVPLLLVGGMLWLGANVGWKKVGRMWIIILGSALIQAILFWLLALIMS